MNIQYVLHKEEGGGTMVNMVKGGSGVTTYCTVVRKLWRREKIVQKEAGNSENVTPKRRRR